MSREGQHSVLLMIYLLASAKVVIMHLFFRKPFASLTAFSGCKSQNMFSYLMTYLPNNTVAQYHQIITANCYNYA